jgi:hypothetical protein
MVFIYIDIHTSILLAHALKFVILFFFVFSNLLCSNFSKLCLFSSKSTTLSYCFKENIILFSNVFSLLFNFGIVLFFLLNIAIKCISKKDIATMKNIYINMFFYWRLLLLYLWRRDHRWNWNIFHRINCIRVKHVRIYMIQNVLIL